LLSQRRFGVEIECGYPGGTEACRAMLKKEKIKPLDVGYDGSGVEVRSPILKGTKGLEWLKECMQAIRENDGYVTRADGMHVHHEGKPGYRDGIPKVLSALHCIRLVHSWGNNNDHLCQFVAERRRLDSASYCGKVWKRQENLKKAEELQFPGKYSDLNLRPLNSLGTIEVRLHEGTLDFNEAEAWIRLCQSLIDHAANADAPLPKQKNPKALLDLLLDSDEIKQRLLDKAARKGEPSPDAGFRDSRTDDYSDD
jgi:hypothetical protein